MHRAGRGRREVEISSMHPSLDCATSEMPDTAAILKKIRRLELRTRRLVDSAFGGQYHSVFKGRGMNFEDVRAYNAGDEVRFIDTQRHRAHRRPARQEFHRGTRTHRRPARRCERFGLVRQRLAVQARTRRRSRQRARFQRRRQPRQGRPAAVHRRRRAVPATAQGTRPRPADHPRGALLPATGPQDGPRRGPGIPQPGRHAARGGFPALGFPVAGFFPAAGGDEPAARSRGGAGGRSVGGSVARHRPRQPGGRRNRRDLRGQHLRPPGARGVCQRGVHATGSNSPSCCAAPAWTPSPCARTRITCPRCARSSSSASDGSPGDAQNAKQNAKRQKARAAWISRRPASRASALSALRSASSAFCLLPFAFGYSALSPPRRRPRPRGRTSAPSCRRSRIS